ncbi:MAG: DUF5658 family protein [Desulfobacterales bacterium]|jgi:hypothetical protein
MESDKRSGTDRRKQTGISVRLLVGNGNRTIIRRREDQGGIFLVDQYSPVLFVTIVGIMLLCVMDALLTLFLLDHGAYEANPLMAYLLSLGPYAFIIPKYGLTALVIFGLFLFKAVLVQRFHVSTHTLIYVGAWIYAAVVAWELYLIYYAI